MKNKLSALIAAGFLMGLASTAHANRYLVFTATANIDCTGFLNGGKLTTRGTDIYCDDDKGTGASGSGTLGVFQNSVQITSPTVQLNFISPPFLVTNPAGSTASVTLNGSSVTLQGNTFNTASHLLQLTGSALISNALIDPSSVTKLGPFVSLSSGVTANLSTSSLNSGVNASSNTFWRGDGIWSTPPPTNSIYAATSTAIFPFGFNAFGGSMSGFEMKLYDSPGFHYSGLKSSNVYTNNLSWILPSSSGTAGQVLTTDANMNLYFSTPAPSLSVAIYPSSSPIRTPGLIITSDGIHFADGTVQTSSAPVITYGSITVVHPNGTRTAFNPATDSDSDRGLALRAATATAIDGDNFYLAASTYDVGNFQINMTIGSHGHYNLHGAGMYQTVLTGTTGTTLLHVGPNCEITDMGVIDTNLFFGIPIGTESSLDISKDFPNVEIRNVFTKGPSDGVYVYAHIFNWTVRNLVCHSNWDCVNVLSGLDDSSFSIYDSSLTTTYDSAFVGAVTQHGVISNDAVVNVFNTIILSSGSPTSNHGIFGNYLGSGGHSKILVSGGSIQTSGASAYDVVNGNASTPAFGTVTVMPDVLYDPTKTSGTISYPSISLAALKMTGAITGVTETLTDSTDETILTVNNQSNFSSSYPVKFRTSSSNAVILDLDYYGSASEATLDFTNNGSLVGRIDSTSNDISMGAGSGGIGTNLEVNNTNNQVSIRNTGSTNPLKLKFDSSSNDGTITWTPSVSSFSTVSDFGFHNIAVAQLQFNDGTSMTTAATGSGGGPTIPSTFTWTILKGIDVSTAVFHSTVSLQGPFVSTNTFHFARSSGTFDSGVMFSSHVLLGTQDFGVSHNIGISYPSLSIYTTGGDALNVGNANGWVELGVEAVALEMGLISMNDEFIAVKDSFPGGGFTYGGGALKASYGTGAGDGDVSVGGAAVSGQKLFSWGTGDGGTSTQGQFGWGDKTNGVPLGLLTDVGDGMTGAMHIKGDSVLAAPFGEIGEFDIMDRSIAGDARIAITVGRKDTNVGGFRYDIGIRNAANSVFIPFGVTPSGVYISNDVDGLEPSAYLTLGQGIGDAGTAPLKIIAGAALMTTPEQGAFESDPSATLYYDQSSTMRGQFAFINSSQTWTAAQTFGTLTATNVSASSESATLLQLSPNITSFTSNISVVSSGGTTFYHIPNAIAPANSYKLYSNGNTMIFDSSDTTSNQTLLPTKGLGPEIFVTNHASRPNEFAAIGLFANSFSTGAGGGDTLIQFGAEPGNAATFWNGWSIGRDNSDGGSFKFATSATLGAGGDVMRMAASSVTISPSLFSSSLTVTSAIYNSNNAAVNVATTSNNLALPGTPIFYATATVASTITGFAAQTVGYRFTLVNVGTNSITVAQESGTSTAANRIWTNTGSNTTIGANVQWGASAEFLYDTNISRWRQLR